MNDEYEKLKECVAKIGEVANEKPEPHDEPARFLREFDMKHGIDNKVTKELVAISKALDKVASQLKVLDKIESDLRAIERKIGR